MTKYILKKVALIIGAGCLAVGINFILGSLGASYEIKTVASIVIGLVIMYNLDKK